MKIETCKNTSDAICFSLAAICVAFAISSISGCAKVYNETERDIAKAKYESGVINAYERKEK